MEWNRYCSTQREENVNEKVQWELAEFSIEKSRDERKNDEEKEKNLNASPQIKCKAYNIRLDSVSQLLRFFAWFVFFSTNFSIERFIISFIRYFLKPSILSLIAQKSFRLSAGILRFAIHIIWIGLHSLYFFFFV